MSIEAMKQALEALELMYACYAHPEWISHKQQEEKILAQCVATTMTLRQAIADAEKQEPIGYLEIQDIEDQREYPHNCRAANLWYEGGEGLVAVYTHPQPKREPPTPLEVKDVLRATGLLTNSQAWDVAEEVMKLLAAHGITGNMKQEHVDKTAKQRHEWVGLTDEEREEATGWSVEHIEAKLKEKNT